MKLENVNTALTRVIAARASFVPFDRSGIEQSLSTRFEQQVRRAPDKIAVKTTTQMLRYAELNRAANRIAHAVLDTIGDGNDPVALFIRNEALAIPAIIGLLKARKIYVPLDPADSAARNATILEESQAKLVLSDGRVDRFGAPDVRFLDVSALSGASSDDPGLDIAPDDLAYIFYTSGSTGRPKGVVDSHRNVLHNVMRYTNSLKISPDDRLTLLQAFNFSGSVSSLLCALLNGATSYPFDLRRDGPARLVEWLADESITMYHSVPSIFRLVAVGEREFPAMRIIRLEGDRARPKDVELFKAKFPDACVLVNGLGATECGLVRQFFVDKSTPTPDDVVPIGRAVEDMNVVLLDEYGDELGPDTVGEIAIESAYLATGYWRRPDLTEAAFRAHPTDRMKRIYRTGDLGCMRANGCLDYLGRKHFQLKIRGLWVDVAAVEQALHAFGGFRDAIVHTHDGRDGEATLVAYLVPSAEPPTASAIRAFLAQRLPEHMVPASFVFLDRLPLDANGKIDRKSLPPPGQKMRSDDRMFAAPDSMLQLQLQHIWQSVLAVDRIGIRDDFFQLGGDSLQALNMLIAVERATGRAIAPDALLAGPTIERLADYICTETKHAGRALVEINQRGERRPFHFLHGDYESGGFYTLKIARGLGSDQPFYALPPCGTNGHPAPASYGEMAAIHLRALRARQPAGPYMLGGTCNGGLVAYEMARQLVAAGERVDLLVLIGSSARNLRFRALRRLLAPLSDARADAKSFGTRLSGGVARLDQWWAKQRSLPPREHPQLMRRRVQKGYDLLRYVIQGDSRNGKHTTSALYPLYQRIDQEYVPQKYNGKVTLLWSAGESEPLEEAVRWWRMIAGDVELHVLPGATHQEALTAHPDVVAACLKSCIESAETTRDAAPRSGSSARP